MASPHALRGEARPSDEVIAFHWTISQRRMALGKMSYTSSMIIVGVTKNIHNSCLGDMSSFYQIICPGQTNFECKMRLFSFFFLLRIRELKHRIKYDDSLFYTFSIFLLFIYYNFHLKQGV